MKNILVSFAEKIDIINMNNIPMKHTIELMKNRNNIQKKDKFIGYSSKKGK